MNDRRIGKTIGGVPPGLIGQPSKPGWYWAKLQLHATRVSDWKPTWWDQPSYLIHEWGPRIHEPERSTESAGSADAVLPSSNAEPPLGYRVLPLMSQGASEPEGYYIEVAPQRASFRRREDAVAFAHEHRASVLRAAPSSAAEQIPDDWTVGARAAWIAHPDGSRYGTLAASVDAGGNVTTYVSTPVAVLRALLCVPAPDDESDLSRPAASRIPWDDEQWEIAWMLDPLGAWHPTVVIDGIPLSITVHRQVGIGPVMAKWGPRVPKPTDSDPKETP